jgi:uncharacterized repeat protein (TIGR02543 family)
VYAGWSPNIVFRKFYHPNTDDEVLNMPEDNNVYLFMQEATILPETVENLPIRSGYDFIEWNTQADGQGQSLQPGETIVKPNSDTHLYAQWQEQDKKITVDQVENKPEPMPIEEKEEVSPTNPEIKEVENVDISNRPVVSEITQDNGNENQPTTLPITGMDITLLIGLFILTNLLLIIRRRKFEK